MSSLRYDGRVAVVTGAGAGLGRAYALLLGSRGAKVVVNDLGGGRHGDGNSSSPADAVVREIKQMGGEAVPDYNSVVDGDKIIKTALDSFGRVDIVINNAGILRDKSFARISDQDWNLIHDVHVKGSFKTTQAAWPIFRKQGFGRVIMTSSNAGLYGNFGQANYSAAKMALVGLSNTLAIEGNKNNIHCNVIVPTAASRLTEDILPPDLFAQLKPELIAPVVAFLCHESCEENGSIIEAAAGWAGKCHLLRSKGRVLRQKMLGDVTVESVRDNWSSITDMQGAEHYDSIQAVTGALMQLMPGTAPNEVPQEDFVFSSGFKDWILYAIAVGASVSNPDELRFLYENHEDFSPLPSFMVIPILQSAMSDGIMMNAVPGKQVSFENILHGEQYLEISDLSKIEGKLTVKNSLGEVMDKGSGAVIPVNSQVYNESGELVASGQTVCFAVGCGNFGGPKTSQGLVPLAQKPSRRPDAVVSQKTSLDQAALYRLTGDLNPLHIDPNMAPLMNFKKPILHGLCSMGFSVRHVLASFASNDSSLFKALKVRFVKPVYPGETLRTEMWREGNRIFFETSVEENKQVVIAGAYVDLKNVTSASAATPTASSALQSDQVFLNISEMVKSNPDKAKSINGVFQIKITKDGKEAKDWTLDLKGAKVYEGSANQKPDSTMVVSDEHFVQLAKNELNPQTAFMKGFLKVSGNIMMIQKLSGLFKASSKL